MTCASHRTPHSERLPAWFNALQSPFEILNTFLTKGLVLSFCNWPYKLCSQPWWKFPLYPTKRVKMCPTFALDSWLVPVFCGSYSMASSLHSQKCSSLDNNINNNNKYIYICWTKPEIWLWLEVCECMRLPQKVGQLFSLHRTLPI